MKNEELRMKNVTEFFFIFAGIVERLIKKTSLLLLGCLSPEVVLLWRHVPIHTCIFPKASSGVSSYYSSVCYHCLLVGTLEYPRYSFSPAFYDLCGDYFYRHRRSGEYRIYVFL